MSEHDPFHDDQLGGDGDPLDFEADQPDLDTDHSQLDEDQPDLGADPDLAEPPDDGLDDWLASEPDDLASPSAPTFGRFDLIDAAGRTTFESSADMPSQSDLIDDVVDERARE